MDGADRAVSILADLVAFDTTSRLPNLDLVAYLERALAPLGFALERFPDETGAKANLWATIGPADRPGIVLSGHTDVVPVDGQDWSSDPFRLVEREGRLYGRGACDMKGFLAVLLALAPEMAAAPLARPIHLAFTYDEEVGCRGAHALCGALAARAGVPRPSACFVGEPTGMGVVVGHKAKRSALATARGRGGHSSLAPHAVNAVAYAALLAARIDEIARRLAETGPRDGLYDVPFSTAHVGVLRGGTALNIVPDRAELHYEIRAIAADDPDALLAEIEAYARDALEPRMRAIDPKAGFDFAPTGSIPGLDTPPEAEVATLAKRLVARNDHAKVAYGTEGGLFSRVLGVPTVIVGPGSIAQAHQPDEWIARSELSRCMAFVRGVIAECAR